MVQADKVHRERHQESKRTCKRLELMPIRVPNLPYILKQDPKLYETIVALHQGLQSLVNQAGLGASGSIPPPAMQSISVTAANGIFSVALVDKSLPHLGISYFVEYADNPAFDNVHTLYL